MVRQKLSRLKYLFLVGIVSASFAVNIASPVLAANLAESEISSELSGKVLDHQLYYYALSCFAQADMDKVTADEVKEWRWLWGSDKKAVRGDMYENSYVNCSDGQWMKEAFGRFGFTDALNTFCSLSFTFNRESGGLGETRNGGSTKEACIAGIGRGDFDGSGSTSGQVKAVAELFATAPNGAAAKGALSAPAEYVRKYRTFMQGCQILITQEYNDTTDPAKNSDKLYKVPIVTRGTDGQATVKDYLGQGLRDGFKRTLVATSTGGSQTTDCGTLASDIRGLAGAYARYLNTTGVNDTTTDTNNSDNPGPSEPVCSAGALGWVLCPLTEAMVGAIEEIAELLESFLIFQPLTSSEQGRAIRAIWESLLAIANAGLAIAFLIIVFSQATSVGLSSYGIKKLLPRVIAAAILMNLSFYLCAIAVDISNILGVSIKSIVDAGLNTITDVSTINPDLQQGAGIGQWLTVLAGGAVVAAIAIGTGAIFMLFPIVVSALLAVLTAFLIIAARQVLITLLIIVAPLAILAWVLPNTEEWFKRWRKLFTVLLIMFPMVMAIFYGAVLVSAVTLTAARDGEGGLNDWSIQILAFMVLFVPLFSLPFIMKSAGGIMDRLGVIANNRNKGLVDRSRKKGQELYDRGSYARGRGIRQQAKTEFRNKKFASRLSAAENARTLTEALDKRASELGKASSNDLTAAERASATADWSNARRTRRMAGGLAGIRTDIVNRANRVDPATGQPDAPFTNTLLGNKTDQRLVASPIASAQSSALVRAAQGQEAKAFSERVGSYISSYERGGSAGADTSKGGYLEQQYQEAVLTKNHEQAAAVVSRLTNLGAGGRNRLADILKTHEVHDPGLQDTIIKSVMQDNYGDLVKARADTAKANRFDASGKWDTAGALGKVGTSQLATQDEKTLYQNFTDISQTEADKIMSEPNLESMVQNAKARAILRARAAGATSLPTTGLIDPTDPALGSWSDLGR